MARRPDYIQLAIEHGDKILTGLAAITEMVHAWRASRPRIEPEALDRIESTVLDAEQAIAELQASLHAKEREVENLERERDFLRTQVASDQAEITFLRERLTKSEESEARLEEIIGIERQKRPWWRR